MSIAPDDQNIGSLKLNYSKKQTFEYIESTQKCVLQNCDTPIDQTLSTDITLSISSSLPTKISGSGSSQSIDIAMSDKSVAVSARTSGGGSCGSKDLQAQVNGQLQSSLPSQITSKINVSFGSVSVFMLQNLLFPSNNYINLQNAYVPGDLLIVGNFGVDDGNSDS